jgi:hypothetical protein
LKRAKNRSKNLGYFHEFKGDLKILLKIMAIFHEFKKNLKGLMKVAIFHEI